ncbi:MAG: septum formation initiator [Lachnospiraceae bacterium]|nr:septum formation initiator [Lachnospiraceae bacterium]
MIAWTQLKKIKEDNKKNRQLRKFRFAITIVIAIIICLVINYQRINLKKKQLEYNNKISRLDVRLDEEKARSDEIEEFKAYVQTKQFAEDVAREKLGLVYPDEIIFKENEED